MYRATRGSMLEKVYALVAREEERRSGYHWFLHTNMNMFGPNDYIDYPRLVLSDGSLQLPFGMKATAIHADKLELEWLDNTSTVTAQATDQLTVAAIFDNEPYQPVVLNDTGFCRKPSYPSRKEHGQQPIYIAFSLPKTGNVTPPACISLFPNLKTRISWQSLNRPYFKTSPVPSAT